MFGRVWVVVLHVIVAATAVAQETTEHEHGLAKAALLAAKSADYEDDYDQAILKIDELSAVVDSWHQKILAVAGAAADIADPQSRTALEHKPNAKGAKAALAAVSAAEAERDWGTAAAKLDVLRAVAASWRERVLTAKADEEAEASKPKIEHQIAFYHKTTTKGYCYRETVKAGSTLVIHYVGRITSSQKVFDQTKDTPFKFRLGSKKVVEGLNKGLEGICSGEHRTIYIPWGLGYGEEGGNGVPPYTNIEYDVNCISASFDGRKKKKKKAKDEV